MFLKFTEGKVLEKVKPEFVKAANQVIEEADPDYIYIRVRAVTAKAPNKNGDFFSEQELLKAYKTFIGKGVYLNHNSKEVENSIGKIIDAEWIAEELSVDCLLAIDKKRADVKLVRGIEQGDIKDVSMGCKVEYSLCSICGNKAFDETDFCEHILKYKGRKIQTADGVKEVFEDNRGVEFFEISFVTTGADPDATIIEKVAGRKAQLDRARAEEVIEEWMESTWAPATKDPSRAKDLLTQYLEEEDPSLADLKTIQQLMEVYESKIVDYFDDKGVKKEMKTHGQKKKVLAGLIKREQDGEEGLEDEIKELQDEIEEIPEEEIPEEEIPEEEVIEEPQVPTDDLAAKIQELEANISALEAEGIDVKGLRDKVTKLKKSRVEKELKEIEKQIKGMQERAGLTKEGEGKTGSVFDAVTKLYLPQGFYAVEEMGKAIVKDKTNKTISTLELAGIPDDPAGAINYIVRKVKEIRAAQEAADKESQELPEEEPIAPEITEELIEQVIAILTERGYVITPPEEAPTEEVPLEEVPAGTALPSVEELVIQLSGEGADKTLKFPVDGKYLILRAGDVFPDEQDAWETFGSEEYQEELKKEIEKSGIERVLELTGGTLEEVKTEEGTESKDLEGLAEAVKKLTLDLETEKKEREKEQGLNKKLRETIRLYRALQIAEQMAEKGFIEKDQVTTKAKELAEIEDEEALEKVLSTFKGIVVKTPFKQEGLTDELPLGKVKSKEGLAGINWSTRGPKEESK